MSIYHHGDTQVFYVNSTNRVSGSSDTNFSVALNILPNNSFNRICLMQLSVPKSFYNFYTGNNTLVLRELGLSYTVTFTPGS